MKKIILILISLILIMLILSWLLNRQQVPEKGILTIRNFAGETFNINSFPDKEAQQLKTGKGDFQAIPISYFLKEETDSGNWTDLVFYSSDGAEVRINRQELSGLYLARISDQDSFYLRLIIPGDDFAQRWLKYINRIELK